jgi:folate/biopterin transporter
MFNDHSIFNLILAVLPYKTPIFDSHPFTCSALCYAGLGTNFGGFFDTANGIESPISLLQATIASLVISSGCIAFSDVVADGIVVQRTRESDDPKVAGGLQSLCWGSACIGALISAYFSGSLLEVMGPKDVFAITAALPLIVAFIAFFINEDPIPKNEKYIMDGENSITPCAPTAIEFQPETSYLIPAVAVQNVDGEMKDKDGSAQAGDKSITTAITTNYSVKQEVELLLQAIKLPAIWKPTLFIFLWQSTPTSDGALLYFMTNDLGMGPEFLGRVRLITAAASLAGVWGYQKYLRTVPIKDILFWTSIASAPLGLIQQLLITHANRDLGIPDGAFVLGDDVGLAVLGQLAFLPILVLAAKICPPGIEAVLFATLMSIFNGASTVGTEIGAVLTKQLGVTESNFDNLGLLNIICSLSSLYPLLFIGLLDGIGTKSEAEMEEEAEAEAKAE